MFSNNLRRAKSVRCIIHSEMLELERKKFRKLLSVTARQPRACEPQPLERACMMTVKTGTARGVRHVFVCVAVHLYVYV